MELSVQRVLILACSARKRPDAGLLPALERYDGPAFRVLRRYLRDRPPDPPEVHILSAEFGLIPATQPVPDYDRRMTAARARALRSSVQEALGQALDGFDGDVPAPEQLLVCLGRDYGEAVSGYAGPAAEVLPLRSVRAGLGRRLAILHDWLRET